MKSKSDYDGSVPDIRSPGDAANVEMGALRVDAARLFVQTSEQSRMAMCLSDARAPDFPIVYANRSFANLTGYSVPDAVGRNCRFLQGPETDPEAVTRLRGLIERAEYGVVDILNYRKDGSSFWNAVHIGPIFGDAGQLEYFYGSQWDISEVVANRETQLSQDRIARELRHRTDNLFAVISAIVRLSARGSDDVASLSEKLTQRIAALATAHRISIDSEARSDQESDLGTLAREILAPYANDNTRRIAISGEDVLLPSKAITPIGLALHELATNALKYGSLSVAGGELDVSWRREDNLLRIVWSERGGPTVVEKQASPSDRKSGSGSRIIAGVLGSLKGTIDFDYRPEGLRADLCIPVD